MAIFIHEEYIFRTSSYQILTSIVESEHGSEQATLIAVGSGGGGCICNFNWEPQSASEDTIINNVRNLIEGHSRRYDDWSPYEIWFHNECDMKWTTSEGSCSSQ